MPLSLSDSYPCLIPLSVHLCLFLCPLLLQCICVLLHVPLRVSMWVASLEEGLFFQLTPGCCILTPVPSICPRSLTTLLFISGRWLEGCWIPCWLDYHALGEFGSVGRPEDGPWSLRTAKDSCFVISERHQPSWESSPFDYCFVWCAWFCAL